MNCKGSSELPSLSNRIHTYPVYHTCQHDDIATNTLKLYTRGEGLNWNPSSVASTCATRFSSRYSDAFIEPPGANGWDNLDSPGWILHDFLCSPDDSHIVPGAVARTTTQNLSSVNSQLSGRGAQSSHAFAALGCGLPHTKTLSW